MIERVTLCCYPPFFSSAVPLFISHETIEELFKSNNPWRLLRPHVVRVFLPRMRYENHVHGPGYFVPCSTSQCAGLLASGLRATGNKSRTDLHSLERR
jgi:hypothetical protein